MQMQDIYPPAKKPKKILKIFLVFLAILFIILLAVTLTYFLTKEKFQKKESKEESIPLEVSKEENFVYVSSKSGLNMRNDASISSEIIYTLPYRAKIKIDKKSSDEKWYKGSYEGVAGWFSAEYTQKEEPPDLTASWQDQEIDTIFSYSLKYPTDWKISKLQNSSYDFRIIPNAGVFDEIYIHIVSTSLEETKKSLVDSEHNLAGESTFFLLGIKGKKLVIQRVKNSKVIYAEDVILLEKDGKTIKIVGPADSEKFGDIFNLFVWTIRFK